ncbi:hypothetical protein [Paracoccus sp. (in: a-proteobacteria)]|uniref:hypothetical protein n=1 Tax=Paracoccus sp. TaxID=267 RepID=UPI0032206B2C
MSYAYKSLLTPKNVQSGISEYILFAPVEWFTTIATPTAPFTNQGDSIRITADHVFAASKGFVKMQLAPRKNKFDMKSVGDIGLNKLVTDAVEFFVPGSYAEAHEQMKNLINTPLVCLVKDAQCEADILYQFGCDCQSAWITVEFGTGTTNEGVKGFSGKMVYDGSLFLYEGAVTLLP